MPPKKDKAVIVQLIFFNIFAASKLIKNLRKDNKNMTKAELVSKISIKTGIEKLRKDHKVKTLVVAYGGGVDNSLARYKRMALEAYY